MAQLIISDIHADIRALDAIMEITRDQAFIDLYGEITRIINLGDVVGWGFHPIEVIERLIGCGADIDLLSIMGNHDEAFLLNRDIIGNSSASRDAHSDLRGNQRCMQFLKGLPPYMVDEADRILAVHGGPIDPSAITERTCPDRLLYRRTWQRISECGYDYCDGTGYHYTPEHAFEDAMESLGSGVLILCGHEHLEACHIKVNGKQKNVIGDMIRREEVFSNRSVSIRAMIRQEGVSYLIRVGIAGPAGYVESEPGFGDSSHFGLIWEQRGADWVGLFSFQV